MYVVEEAMLKIWRGREDKIVERNNEGLRFSESFAYDASRISEHEGRQNSKTAQQVRAVVGRL